jgi:hypothetical protein
MELIKSIVEKAISTLTSTSENSQQKKDQIEFKKKKRVISWLPIQFDNNYYSTDLEYSFCVELFGQLEAAKRDDIPETTMRQWFIEFIKAGWTKEMVKQRYEGVLRSPKYGAIDFHEWVTAVPVYSEDETRLIIKQKIDAIIQRGKYLLANKEKFMDLTDADKQAIDVALCKEVEFEIRNEKLDLIDEYKIIRKKQLKEIKEAEIKQNANTH